MRKIRLRAIAVASVLCTCSFLLTFSSCSKKETRDSCDITVEYDDGRIYGKSSYTYTNRCDEPLSEIKFELYANAYRAGSKYAPVEASAKENTFKRGYGSIKITSAKVDGENSEYEICGEDENILSVKNDEIFPLERVTVELDFETTLPKAALRLGETGSTVTLGDFFPVPCKVVDGKFVECTYSPFGDPYYSDCYDYTVSLTLPSTYTVASSGYPDKTDADGDKTTYSYSLSGGRDFAFVLSEDFRVASVRKGDVTVNAYTLGENGDDIATLASDAIEYFSSAFGDYPYKTFSVAVTPFNCGGMEYSGLCFISDELEGLALEYAIVHEVAHEWWHCLVGNDQINAAYIDEGLAEYSTYLYLKNNGREQEATGYLDDAKKSYKAFFDINKTLSGNVDTGMAKSLNSYSSIGEYVAICYDKSLVMFAKYADTVGEAKALKLLKKLVREKAYSDVGLTDLTKILGLKEFFVSFVDGKVLV